MRSVRVLAVGRVLGQPQLIAVGERGYARLCLVGEGRVRRRLTSAAVKADAGVWFIAFDAMALALVRQVRCGDQLRLQAQVRSDQPFVDLARGPPRQVLVVRRFRLSVRRARRVN